MKYFAGAAIGVMTDVFSAQRQNQWISEKYITQTIASAAWAEVCQMEVETSDLLAEVSSYLTESQRWEKLARVASRAMNLRGSVLGEKHERTTESMIDVGEAYHGLGCRNEPDTVWTKALELSKEVLGETHAHRIRLMSNLGKHYRARRWNIRADKMNVKSLELGRKFLGDSHPHTIQSMQSLMEAYR